MPDAGLASCDRCAMTSAFEFVYILGALYKCSVIIIIIIINYKECSKYDKEKFSYRALTEEDSLLKRTLRTLS